MRRYLIEAAGLYEATEKDNLLNTARVLQILFAAIRAGEGQRRVIRAIRRLIWHSLNCTAVPNSIVIWLRAVLHDESGQERTISAEIKAGRENAIP